MNIGPYTFLSNGHVLKYGEIVTRNSIDGQLLILVCQLIGMTVGILLPILLIKLSIKAFNSIRKGLKNV